MEAITGLQDLKNAAFIQKTSQCNRCGMCLQACPTYAVTGLEMESPRGRIGLMRAAAEGRISAEDFAGVFNQHIAYCILCRSCETACPSGVHYGELVQEAHHALEKSQKPGAMTRLLYWIGLERLMPNLGRLRAVARLMRIYEASGLQRLVRKLNFLPGVLRVMEGILPPLNTRYSDYKVFAPAAGERRGRVAFFIGCIQEAFLAPVNQASVRVLQRNGFDVYFPQGQTCCGAAHIHTTGGETAFRLARQNIDAFLAESWDAIIVSAGGCGAALREDYPKLLKDDPAYAQKALQFSAKVRDLNEFLIERGLTPPQGKIDERVAYSDSCHLRNVQKVVEPPRRVLEAIPGLELVELAHPERCCGSGGIYNFTQAKMAEEVLQAKLAEIAASRAGVVAVANPGCQMQLTSGVRRAGLKVRVAHVAELLDESYRMENH